MSTDIPDLIAGALGVSRGTAYDMMREALAEQPAQQEPVGRVCFGGDEVVWTDEPPESGALLYTSPQAQPAREPLTDEHVDKAAMKLAECMDYPWAQMPEQGKQSMRSHAKAVIEASGITKGNT